MSEENTQTNQQTEPQGTEQHGNQGNTYNPPATQAELDRIVENRLQRERNKYADYDQLKADSEKLGSVVAERDDYTSQLDAAKAELATYKASEERRSWAEEVAKEKGVPAEALRGETKEEMEAHADTLKKYMGSAPVVSGDGKSPSTPAKTSTRDQFAAALEGII